MHRSKQQRTIVFSDGGVVTPNRLKILLFDYRVGEKLREEKVAPVTPTRPLPH
jgi:hypothetical protein